MNRTLFNKVLQHPFFKTGLIGLVICYALFTQFYRLGEPAIIQWDESRLAVNAAEMSKSGKLLVTTYEGEPDLFNTKPPLMIWLQALSIHCFGITEWAVRFPSALAGFLLILICGYFVWRKTKHELAVVLGMLILITCDGLIQLHGSITGDFDALLTLFLVAAFFSLEHYGEHKGRKSLLWFAVFTAAALMTKSAAALLFYPVFGCLFLMHGGIKNIKPACLTLGLALLPMALFFIAREQAAPGYLKAIWQNDFGGRFLREKDGHEGQWYYYIEHLFNLRFSVFIWLLPVTMIYGFIKKHSLLNRLSVVIIVFLFFVSAAQTKLEWYDIPALPFIALHLGIGLTVLLNDIKPLLLKGIGIVAVMIMLVQSLVVKFNFTYSHKGMRLAFYLYEMSGVIKAWSGPEQLYYYNGGYDAWLYFYTIQKDNIHRCDLRKLKKDDIIVIENNTIDSFRNISHFKTLDSLEHVRTIRITDTEKH